MPLIIPGRSRRISYPEPRPVSSSLLWSFQDCPRAFHYTYIRRMKPGESPDYPEFGYIRFGTVMHNLIRDFWKPDSTPKFKKAESYAGAFKGRWCMELRERIRGLEDVPEKAEFGMNPKLLRPGIFVKWAYDGEQWVFLNVGMEMSRRFYERRVQEQAPVAVEIPFNIEIPAGPRNFRISGRVDEINVKDGGISIRDYKTSPGRVSHFLRERKRVFSYVDRFLREQGLYSYLGSLGISSEGVKDTVDSMVEERTLAPREDEAFLSQQLTFYAIAGACLLAEGCAGELQGSKKGHRFYGICDDDVLKRIPDVDVELYDVYTGQTVKTRKTRHDVLGLIDAISWHNSALERNLFPANPGTNTCPRCCHRKVCESERARGYRPPEQGLLEIKRTSGVPKARVVRSRKSTGKKQGRLFTKMGKVVSGV